jgi:hypothetical protein
MLDHRQRCACRAGYSLTVVPVTSEGQRALMGAQPGHATWSGLARTNRALHGRSRLVSGRTLSSPVPRLRV